MNSRQTLCIYSPVIGYSLHTYLRDEIRRLSDVCDVVVVGIVALKGGWEPDCPVLAAAHLHPDELAPDEGWDKQIITNYTGIPESAMTAFSEMCASRAILAFLEEHKVTGVFAQWLHESLPLLDVSKQLGVPYIVRTHGTDIAAGMMDEDVRHAYAAYNECSGVLTGSAYASTLVEGLGIDKERLSVASFGMELPEPPAQPMQRDDGQVNVLCVSRIERMKGSLFSLEGFRQAAARDERLFLNVVGDGSLLAGMKQLAQAFCIEDRVRFWGRLPNQGPELRKLWRESDIFLQASVSVADESSIETFGVAVLEALSHGLPTVVSHSQALPEMVVPGESGLVVPEADSAAIAEAILAIASDAGLARRLSVGARQRVREHYSVDKQCRTVFAALGLSYPAQ